MRQKRLRNAYLIVVVMTVLLSIAALTVIWTKESGYRDSKDDVSQVKIVGSYYLNDSEDALPLYENTKFNLKGINTITVYGAFTEEIQENMKVLMRIDNMKVHIEINGQTVYTFGENKSVGFAKSAGNLWDSFLTEGITKEDQVKITLTNLYTNHVNSTFDEFFSNIYYGNDHDFVKDTLQDKLLNSFFAILIVCMGIFAGVFACMSYHMKKPAGMLACFSGLSISSGIWFFIDFDIQNILFPSPVFNNSLDMIMMMLTAYFVLCFLARHITSRWSGVLRINAFCFILSIQFAIVMQFLGILDYYETYPAMYIFGGSGCIFAIIAVVQEWYHYRTKSVARLMVTSMLLAAGALGDLICIYTEVVPYMFWFRIAILLFLMVEFIEIIYTVQTFIIESAKVSVLENMAYKDALTGVKNRAAYLEKIHLVEKKLDGRMEFAVIVFDINNLKVVNDSDGHEQGDQLIQQACHLMESVFGSEDLYRIGGDEFVIVLEGKKCIARFEELQKFETICRKHRMEIAYGTAVFCFKDDHCYHDVFSRADEAMYERKKQMKREAAIAYKSSCGA